MRNTFANILSKNQVDYQNPGGTAALPALSPASTANYYSQLAGLYAGYQNTLAGAKLQRVGIRSGLKTDLAGIKAEGIEMKATAVNTALDRGIVGSTVDASARAGVDADVAGARAGARSEALQALAQNRLGVSQAGVDYFMGAQGLEAQKLAQQQEALAQQLQANLIISGNESNMDALKAIYKALVAQLGGGGRPDKPRYQQQAIGSITSTGYQTGGGF
jgi:hypothetical protein